MDSDEKELGDGEAEDVDENLADVSSQLRDKAKKDVVNEAKKMMSAAKKATDAGIKEASTDIFNYLSGVASVATLGIGDIEREHVYGQIKRIGIR